MNEAKLILTTDSGGKKTYWIGTWQSSPTGLPPVLEPSIHTTYTPIWVQGTVRYRLRISQGGSYVRIRISNEYGEKPLEIGAVSVGLAGKDFAALPGTLMPVTFADNSGISIPAGAPALTDPVGLPVNSLSDLVVSLYLPHGVDMLAQSIQVNTAVFDGANLTLSETLPPSKPIAARPLVSAIDVLAEGSPRVVVTFGDSITDGVINPDTWERGWPGALSRRLQHKNISVVNAGIGGNRLLQSDMLMGRAALARMDQDVLSVPGLTHIVVLLGTNDIGHGGLFGNAPIVQPAELFAAYSQIVARGHARGANVIGATLPPLGGSDFYSNEKKAVLQAVNKWIRSSNVFDGVIDFNVAMCDMSHKGKLRTEYDVGDGLHPSFAGYQAMADAVEARLFDCD